MRIPRGQVGAPAAKLGKLVDDYIQARRLVRRVAPGKWVVVLPEAIVKPPRCLASRPKYAAQLVGIAVQGWVPFISALTEYNAAKALAIRVLSKPKYVPAAGMYLHLKGLITSILPGWGPVEKMDLQDWLGSMPARRKKPLAAAARRVSEKYWCESWLQFKAFIKTELLPGNEKGPVGLPVRTIADRIIQGPADETHCIAGPWLKPVVKRLKEIWSPDNNIFYASVDSGTLSAWYRRVFAGRCWGVAADYSGFDNSHSRDSWEFVEELYGRARLGKGDARFWRVLKGWRAPKGVMRGMGWAIKYIAKWMNASGRDDTALANALLNGAAMFLAIVSAVIGIPVDHVTKRDLDQARSWCWVAVSGDDSLVAVQRALPLGFRQRLQAAIAQFGFCAEAEKLVVTDEPFDHVFLGMRPYPTRQGFEFGKTIGRAIWKRGWKLDSLDSHLPAWLRGVCQAELEWNRHVPFYADYLHTTLRLLGTGPVLANQVDDNRPWTIGRATEWYDEATVRYVCDGYGLTVGEHAAFLTSLNNIHRLPFVLKSDSLSAMVQKDDL